MTDQPLDLDAILARAAAATPGPWTANDRIGIVTDAAADPLAVFGGGKQDRADAEFTAHAREDIEALAAEIRRLRAELATARERYKAGLRRADEHVNAMSEELKRYADGKETPVLWSVYNAMHRRAATAEGSLASIAALCDAAEKQATRWEHPLPVPEWVDAVRQAMQQPAAVVAHVVADDSKAGKAFTPGREDMEDCYDGILVASLGEDGDAIALTSDKHQALEALDQYFREVCGRPNLLDDATADLRDAYYWLDCGHAVFVRRADGGWDVTEAPANTPGAVPVVWFRHPAAGPIPEPYARRGGPRIW